ncbi:MAG: diguanylate cyclase [Methylococcaceae bacterium]|nr:diguanylate cyclase [Methylococcaceae bacterium]
MTNSKHLPVIAFIDSPLQSSGKFSAEIYNNVDELLSTKNNIDLIVWTQKPIFNDVLKLRQEPRYRFLLMFYTKEPHSSSTRELMDGNPAISDWFPFWVKWSNLLSRCSTGDKILSDREILARYLWLRPNKRLSPVLDLKQPKLYAYPLAEMILGQEADTCAWLEQLLRNDLLVSQDLEDRLHLCRSCGDGHLNYVDTCPQCGAIDLENEVAIHCFACGHVEVQSAFVKDSRLSCPNCLISLRHIGVDYDRPLESLRCKTCQTFFSEGEVIARCLACGHRQQPENLRVFPVYHYFLSEQGQQLVLGRLDKQWDIHLGEEISLKHFYWQTDWCLKLAERNDAPFCLLLLRFKGLERLAEKIGESVAANLVDTLVERFRSASRPTDLVGRLNDETYLKLLPFTTIKGVTAIEKQLVSIMELIEMPGAEDIALEAYHLALPEQRFPGEDASALVARLLEFQEA